MSGFARPHIIGFVGDLFFSTLEIGLKNVRIHPCTHYRVRWRFIFFHSGERTLKCPDSPVHTLSGSLRIYFFPLWRSDSKMSGFTRAHIIGFVGDLFFSTLESGFKYVWIRCRIRQMRVDWSRIRKEKVGDCKISRHVRTQPSLYTTAKPALWAPVIWFWEL